MHGGAILAEAYDDQDNFDDEETILEFQAKEQIAELAMTCIEDGDSIFLGPGTTCYLFVKKAWLL